MLIKLDIYRANIFCQLSCLTLAAAAVLFLACIIISKPSYGFKTSLFLKNTCESFVRTCFVIQAFGLQYVHTQ